jgi:hypothetical protein
LVTKAAAMGWNGPPFNMEELASLCGLKVSFSADLRPDQDACVMPGLVLLNPRKPLARQRYSVAHEVGHTLFPDYAEELERAGRLWRQDGDASEFERLCQVAGAELLLPLEPFLDAVRRGGRDLLATLRLAEMFESSPEATARRLVENEASEAIGLFLKPMEPASGEWLELSRDDYHMPFAPLGVFSSWASDACGELRILRGTSPPRKSAADRAWKRVLLAKGRVAIEARDHESWEHAGVLGEWMSEALTLPKAAGTPREVLCFLRRV